MSVSDMPMRIFRAGADKMNGGGGGGSREEGDASSPSASSPTSFQRIPSESSLASGMRLDPLSPSKNTNKPWERSQSALDLEKRDFSQYKASSIDYSELEQAAGGSVSEHSRVYWDLSQAEDAAALGQQQGKFKISLQTIHQKEEMKSSSSPSVSIQARVVRRMQSETSSTQIIPGANRAEFNTELPCVSVSGGSPQEGIITITSPSAANAHAQFKFTSTFSSQQQSKPNLTVMLSNAVPVMKENIKMLTANSLNEQCSALREMLNMIEQAWATPSIGRDLAYSLCDVLLSDGGLETLLRNCDSDYSPNHEITLGSARVLEQSMTISNREYVAKHGLDLVVKLAKRARDDLEVTQATVGILESLFKHNKDTCSLVIQFGGLDSILYSCRTRDTATLRHCAVALANLAIYGGEQNQHEMIAHKAPEWLFPLAFSNDDSIRYYAFLAIASLSANKELEMAVMKSGTLQLVEPFIKTHNPVDFAQSDRSHIHGQSKEWLHHLVPLLSSKCNEAQSLAAFHFAMEAGIKQQQGKLEVIFEEIGAIVPLKALASGTNKLASKFATQALQIIGEEVPYKLSPQVPLWTTDDVAHWLKQQSEFADLAPAFKECHVDGDLLLLLTEENLREDLEMRNGILRKRFLRELNGLKQRADYDSCDPSHLEDWLRQVGYEFRQYSYPMLKSGADRRILRWLTDDHLLKDCCINNGIHRLRIIEAAKRITSLASSPVDGPDGIPCEKSLDCFISYRRSSGSQLASLLKVHLQLRGFTVFLDIEKLRAGKFDDNLLNSVRNARNFVLVLTPTSLDRCVGDAEQKDWVHREIVAAIEAGCNIIPVLDSFQWPVPDTLPEDMRAICYFNGIRWIHDYQDACVDKLEKFISGEISTRGGPSSIPRASLSKGNSIGSCPPTPEMHGPSFRGGDTQSSEGPPSLSSNGGYLSAEDPASKKLP